MNEDALKQMECAHETFKNEVLRSYVNLKLMEGAHETFKNDVSWSYVNLIFDFLICFNFPVICSAISYVLQADKLKESLETELLSLRERVSQLEYESSMKSEELASATAGKEEAFSSALAEITTLKEESSIKT